GHLVPERATLLLCGQVVDGADGTARFDRFLDLWWIGCRVLGEEWRMVRGRFGAHHEIAGLVESRVRGRQLDVLSDGAARAPAAQHIIEMPRHPGRGAVDQRAQHADPRRY